MGKKILRVTIKALIGILLLYVLLGVAVIPLALPWAARSQGTKLLKHTVKMRSAFFNPFLLRFSVTGAAVLDDAGGVMAGFDAFSVDLSFVRLFAREIRVESVKLDGLKVNAVLLPDGSINLQSLVPAAKPAAAASGTEPKAPETDAGTSAGTSAQKQKEPPAVVIDLISLKDGTVRFTDRAVTPEFSTVLSAVELNVTGAATKPDAFVHAVFKARLDDKGSISLDAGLKPNARPLNMEAAFKLNDYALKVLQPYSGKFTGRGIDKGKLDVGIDYRVVDNKLTASHKVLVQRFTFGDKIESKDALNLPFGLVIALLEDSQGRIKISLPVSGDISDPQFHYMHLLRQVIGDFFLKLVTRPLMFLASAMGAGEGTEEMASLRFPPGRSILSDDERAKLDKIVAGLKDRPRLSVEVNGGYDPVIDWKAVKQDVLDADFRALRGQSKKSDSWIYQTLYQRRFGIRALWALSGSYRLKEGGYDTPKLDAEIKRRLLEENAPDKAGLEALAMARGKVVFDHMLAAGFDPRRITLGGARAAQGGSAYVPTEFTLTVYEGADGAEGGGA